MEKVKRCFISQYCYNEFPQQTILRVNPLIRGEIPTTSFKFIVNVAWPNSFKLYSEIDSTYIFCKVLNLCTLDLSTSLIISALRAHQLGLQHPS